MKTIIIGAGRGIRLMPTTANTPKCFAEIKGRRILDWALAAFRANGLDDIVFIGGYQIDKVREAYPEFTFCHNADWENNNILASLFHAEDQMDEGFVCAYSDILFTPDAVGQALAHPADAPPIPRVTRSSPIASPSCAAKSSSCAKKASLSFKLTTRTFACLLTRKFARTTTTLTAPLTLVSIWSTRLSKGSVISR